MKKKKTTKQIIRQIVREEVAMAIQEVITELKQPIQQVTQQPIQEKKNFSKNSVLNDVLNETANGDDWKTLGGSEFTSDRMNELVGGQYSDMMENKSPTISVNGQTPDFLQKDYRAVMKAVDKKQKQKHGR